MDLINIIFLLVFFIPLLLFALCHKKMPKRKTLKIEQYTTELQEFKPNISICDVTDTDIKKIKTAINTSAQIIGMVFAIDIFAILGVIYHAKNNDTKLLGYIIFFGVLFLLSFLCIAIPMKRDCIFKQNSNFKKQTGIILEYKVKFYRPHANTGPALYTVKLGTYINSQEPVVIQMDIPDVVFDYILKGEPWWIITYNDAPITVIRG
ncbi:MAG: hypothetical protein NC240_10090 [Clostridium sp.]|nr:hypothetical protein [Clostridium sp.]